MFDHFLHNLYAAPVWGNFVKIQKYRTELEKVHRQATIKMAAAYRTAATKIFQLVASSVPIYLMTEDRSYAIGENAEKTRKKMNVQTFAKWKCD